MSTLNLQISHIDDDGYQYAYALPCRLYDNTASLNSSEDIQGFLFRNVTIAQGSTINEAAFSLYCHHADYDSVNVRAYCEDADSAAAMQHNVNSDISSRTKTTAYATISLSDVGVGYVEACDLADAVQEVIDRPGWSSGNNLLVILDNYSSGDFRVQHYDLAGNGAKLDIDYTAPSAGGRKKRLLRQGMRLGAQRGF